MSGSGYTIVRRLGASPGSEVLLARARGPLGFERFVVLKRLAAGFRLDVESGPAASLAREAVAYARLAHPAIVRLYDFVDDHGTLTLVLEHVDGPSLARLVSGLAALGERLDEESALLLTYRVFLALAAAHDARDPTSREYAPVIHRDVCPGNILVPWDGYAKLGDFGIARLSGVPSDTRPGVIKGTVGYLAPEQVRGEPVTIRTDVYAACLVARELLLGAPVFPREGRSEVELLSWMASPRLLPLTTLRPALRRDAAEALDRGLSVCPELRTTSAGEMVAILRGALDLDRARERLTSSLARLRRADEAALRSAAFATRPAERVTTRPPPALAAHPVSAVVPVAARGADTRRSLPPPLPPRLRPPPPLARPGFASRTSSALILETPNVVTMEARASVAPEARPPRAESGTAVRWVLMGAAAAIVAGVGIGVALGWKERAAASVAVASFSSPAPTALPAVSAPTASVAAAAPTSTASAAAAPAPPPAVALAATTGRLLTAPEEKGHRIFVDGRVAGGGGAPIVVRCGKHAVRVGSRGVVRQVDVPCGGDAPVAR